MDSRSSAISLKATLDYPELYQLHHSFPNLKQKKVKSNLKIMMCPLAQKQARHTLFETDTTSARSTKDDSVMLCTYRQACEGMKKTLACLSEHTTAK